MFRAHRYFPALLLVAGVAVATPACAAQTYGYGYPTRGVYGRDIERRAYDYGYREGLEQGNNDARRNRSFSPDSHSEFRNADDGYSRNDGDRSFYRQNYRQGFQVGYRESYDRMARSERLRQPWRRVRRSGRHPRGGSATMRLRSATATDSTSGATTHATATASTRSGRNATATATTTTTTGTAIANSTSATIAWRSTGIPRGIRNSLNLVIE